MSCPFFWLCLLFCGLVLFGSCFVVVCMALPSSGRALKRYWLASVAFRLCCLRGLCSCLCPFFGPRPRSLLARVVCIALGRIPSASFGSRPCALFTACPVASLLCVHGLDLYLWPFCGPHPCALSALFCCIPACFLTSGWRLLRWLHGAVSQVGTCCVGLTLRLSLL